MPTLFDPLKVGAFELPNRIIMAPLTRTRATPDTRVPVPLMAEYYRQRASTGLIISEATSVDPMGVGYPRTPGIWSEEQTEGWKTVTKAVHEAGGRIVLQLWHVGRISDPIYLNGALPVSASAIQPKGHVSLVRPEKTYETPRALDTDEIPGVIAAYKKGAENAKTAGFDGVEIHGANGGSLENRARLMLEVTDAVCEVWGGDRVGMHLAPRGDSHDMGDSNPAATFTYVARELGKRGLAFLCAREARKDDSIGPRLKEAFGGVMIANEGFDQASAEQALTDGVADAVAFGKLIIANPDLVARFAAHAPLNPWNVATFYGPDAEGYTDYPVLKGVPA
jgi:2,4-dienoyl-CoA reductase-like NADH-dependent reductase (Old Yellow Enzyme family)